MQGFLRARHPAGAGREGAAEVPGQRNPRGLPAAAININDTHIEVIARQMNAVDEDRHWGGGRDAGDHRVELPAEN